MSRLDTFVAALTIALGAAFAGVAQAGDYDYLTYVVTGDRAAAPVQAFAKDGLLYLQLRNPLEPPAPVAYGEPVAYTMQSPFMIVPAMPELTLIYGPHVAAVRAGPEPSHGGVVRFEAPIDPLNRPIERQQVTIPHRTMTVRPVVAQAIMPHVVTGLIDVRGPRTHSNDTPQTPAFDLGETHRVEASAQTAKATPRATTSGAAKYTAPVRPIAPARRVAPVAASKPATPVTQRAAPALAAPQPTPLWLVSYDESKVQETYKGKGQLLLMADGTSAGAEAVIAAQETCARAGAQCSVDFDGAHPGIIQIREVKL